MPLLIKKHISNLEIGKKYLKYNDKEPANSLIHTIKMDGIRSMQKHIALY